VSEIKLKQSCFISVVKAAKKSTVLFYYNGFGLTSLKIFDSIKQIAPLLAAF